MEQGQNEQESIGNTLRDIKDEISDKGRKLGKQAKESCASKLDGVVSSTGSTLENIAGSIRGVAPKDGKIASAVTTVADTLESGGKYLSERGVEDIGSDVTGVIKKYPLQAILLGLGLGLVVGKLMPTRRA